MTATNYFEDYYLEMGYFDVDTEVYAADGYNLAGYVDGDSGLTTYVGNSGMGIPSAMVVMSPAIAAGVGRLGDLTFLQAPVGTELVFGNTGVIDLTQTVLPAGFSAFVGPVQTIRLQHRYVAVASLGDYGAVSTGTSVKNWRTYAKPAGNSQLLVGSPAIENKNRSLKLSGFSLLGLGGVTVQGKIRTLRVSGIGTLNWGMPSLANRNKVVTPRGMSLLNLGSLTVQAAKRTFSLIGLNALLFGMPALQMQKRSVTAAGNISTFGDGTPQAQLKDRALPLPGIDLSGQGTPTIELRNRYLRLSGISTLALGGGATITLEIRHLYPSGLSQLATGTAWVSDSPRFIEVGEGFKTSAYGTPRMGFGQQIIPFGWNDERFGSRIVPQIQFCYPRGIAGIWGTSRIWTRTQMLSPVGFLPDGREEYRWGSQVVWNWARHITQNAQTDDETALNPPVMSTYVAIANRNRTIATYSTNPHPLPSPAIENTGRAVLVTGVVAPAITKGMVSHRVRTYPLGGIDSNRFEPYQIIYNAARLIQPAGVAANALGLTARVESNRRKFTIYSYLNALALGRPMIAYRVRKVTIPGVSSIVAPTLPKPVVKLWRRYVASAGIDQSGFGATYLRIHRTIFYPPGIKSAAYGLPKLKNKTPQLYANGHNSSVFGMVSVRTQWRRLTLDGVSSLSFGDNHIADRRLWIAPAGVSKLLFGSRVRIDKTKEDPPVTQKVFPGGLSLLRAGTPNMNQQVAYIEGFSAQGFGMPVAASNGIQATPGIGAFGYGTPTVELWIRTLAPNSIGQSPEFDTSRFPRMTPWTIWAPNGAPEQASRILNRGGLYIDVGGDANNPGIKPGTPTISLAYRSISAGSLGRLTGYGTPSLALRRQYVLPMGYTPSRQGYQMIGPFTQTAVQWGNDAEDPETIYGTPIMINHYTGPQQVSPPGLDAEAFGAADPQLLNRTMLPRGFSGLGMGNSNDEPYEPTYGHQWQKLRIGVPNPTVPGGWDSEVWGSTWISLKIRDVRAAGFDCFACDYTVDDFDGRMKVKRAAITLPVRLIKSGGSPMSAVSTPDIRNKAQYIRPDGNAETYRKGAPLS